jgi:hypothetical protein
MVTNGDGLATQRTKRIHVTTQPVTINSFTPDRGPVGNYVTIYGSHFTDATHVVFNTVPAFFTIDSDGQISAVVPPEAVSGTIHVMTNKDDVRSATDFIVGSANAGPPATTAALSGPLGSSGWYGGAIIVALSASDPDGAPDVAATYYAVDGGQTQAVMLTDAAGNSAIFTSPAVNIDTTPPRVSAIANPATLWPPNGKMVPVKISGQLTDVLSGIDAERTTFSVVDDYGMIQPSGGITVQADASYSFTVMLETKRNGSDALGRHYSITVTAKDRAGNAGAAHTVVTVPHDQGR